MSGWLSEAQKSKTKRAVAAQPNVAAAAADVQSAAVVAQKPKEATAALTTQDPLEEVSNLVYDLMYRTNKLEAFAQDIDTKRDTDMLRRKLKHERETAKDLSKKVHAGLKDLEIKRQTREMNKEVLMKLTRQGNDALRKFDAVYRDCMEKERASAKKKELLARTRVDNANDSIVDDVSHSNEYHMNQSHKYAQALKQEPQLKDEEIEAKLTISQADANTVDTEKALAKETVEELRALETDMNELVDMYADVKNMLVEQQEGLDAALKNVESANAHMEVAVSDLKAANKVCMRATARAPKTKHSYAVSHLHFSLAMSTSHSIPKNSLWLCASKDQPDQANGPLTIDDLKDMFDDGEIDSETLVAEQSAAASQQPQWMKLRDIPALWQYVSASESDDRDQQVTISTFLPGATRVEPPSHAPNDAPITFDESRQSYVYFDESEQIHFEYDHKMKGWVPVLDDATARLQQTTAQASLPRGTKRKQPEAASEDQDTIEQELFRFLGKPDALIEDGDNGEYADDDKPSKRRKKGNEQKSKQSETRSSADTIAQKQKPASTSVYVSNLPLDVTLTEMEEVFKKAGILRDDPDNPRQKKIKLYKDKHTGQFKGDALVTYVRPESVPLAVQLLDDTEFRLDRPSGTHIKVQVASFEPTDATSSASSHPASGSTQHSGKSQKKKVSKEQRAKEQKRLEKQLGWDFDDKDDKFSGQPRTVILKHMFAPSEFSEDPNFGIELKEDVKTEIEQQIGAVERIRIFENHPDGVIEIRFFMPAHAEQCINSFNGRWFGGRRVECSMYDGHTNYVVKETEAQQAARLAHLVGSDDDEDEDEIDDSNLALQGKESKKS